MLFEVVISLVTVAFAQDSYLPLNEYFELGWTFEEEDTIEFYLNVILMKCPNVWGWCGFTFAHGMNNTEMIIASNFGGNNINLINFYSAGYQAPTQITGINGWSINDYSSSSGISVNFARPLSTGQPNDEVLKVGLATPFSYAYYIGNTSVFLPHNNAVQGDIVFGSTTATSSYTLYTPPIPPSPPSSFFTLSPYFSIGWTFYSNQTIEFFLSVKVI